MIRSRRTLSFSLRTMMVLVGLLCVWLAWERSAVVQRRAFLSSIPDGTMVFAASSHPKALPGIEVPVVRRLFGDRAIQIIALPDAKDAPLSREARRLFPEAKILTPVVPND